ncbi:hypothetical protein SAMN05421837_106648 [Amycolatopsis pretoriensis]|uniref:NACHT domain-containing protein n=2 Tax=Amycolatopsis pretoriensis TaxID=218821 RepID=A0A1H5R6Q9_9PSEU|nr:hypothetical protein SAMN05421837_106648 [Amycolatopsis pretoriensis]
MNGFLNNNQGWWGFLALLVPFVPYLWQVGRTLRTARLSDRERWRLLITTMRNDRSLVLRQRRDEFQLPIRMVDASDDALAEPASELLAMLTAGRCAEVVGDAGAGKSYLAVEVRRTGLAAGDEPACVVDLVSARDWHPRRWRRHSEAARARDLAVWASRVLHRRYPQFRRSNLRQLVDEGRIMLAVDGFDEVDSEGADSLWQAIIAHASRLPVLVLRRPGSALSAVTAERLSFYEFGQYTLRPLRERDVAKLLRERFTWFDQLAEARRPHLLRQVLTNPLLLHIALQVCSRTEVPRQILDSADPRAALWSVFLRDRLDGSALARHDPRLSRVLEAVALSSSSSTGRLSEVNHDIRVRRTTIVLVTLTALSIGWYVGSPAMALTTAVSIAAGLNPYRPLRVFGIPLPWFVQRSEVGQICVSLLGTVITYAVFLHLTRAVGMFTEIVAMFDNDPIVALYRHGGSIMDSFWVNVSLVVPTEWNYRDFIWLGLMLQVVSIGRVISLFDTKADAAHALPFWSALPFADKLWARPVLVVILVLALGLDNQFVLIMVLFLLATMVYRAVDLLFFAVRIRSVRCLSPRLLRGLDELGVIYAEGNRFRLVHLEIADRIALDLVRDDRRVGRLVRTIPGHRGPDIVDAALGHRDAARSRPLTQQLARQYPRDLQLASQACLLLLYGIGDPRAAFRAVKRQRMTTNAAHLAEVYWSLRDVRRSRVLLDRIVRRYPTDIFVLHKACRILVSDGEPEAALELLRKAESLTDGPDRWYCQSKAVVLRSEWETANVDANGSSGEVVRAETDTILAELDSLSGVENPMHHLAELELARRWSERYGEHRRALELLRRLERVEGFAGGIICARMAQLYLRLGDDQFAARYVGRIMDELDWDEDTESQLEAAVVASSATGDRRAEAIVNRLMSYGWSLSVRLSRIATEMQALRARQSAVEEAAVSRPVPDPAE